MKLFRATILSAAACLWAGGACAQLQLVPAPETPDVFAGSGREIRVVFHNPTGQPVEADIRTFLLQASSATAAPLAGAAWKHLQVLPGQTVMESASLDFPAVKAETRFIIRWQTGSNTLIGATDVLVYPTNLLKDLKPLVGDADDALGVFDPQNRLKPLLKEAKVDYLDLAESGVENFNGRLAIIGPFTAKTQMPEGLAEEIRLLARKNVGVVWLQPPPGKHDPLQPSFYSLLAGETAVVIVQPGPIAGLADNPQAQLHLIRFCELAVYNSATINI
jgi:hypothetical protein